MNAYDNSIQQYQTLNRYAKVGATVILGGSEDLNIPVGELKQSFELETTIYNRSVAELTVARAADVYDAVVAPLRPSTLILRLGQADLELFGKNAGEFAREYRELIAHVRRQNRGCEIVVVSLSNPDASQTIVAMNASLREIAAASRCSFENVDAAFSGESDAMKETVSFVYSLGFVSQLPWKKPVHNLARILYGRRFDLINERNNNKNIDKNARRLNLTTVSFL
ncbi:MAG: hypothetical protein IJL92_04005 [Thermoguttaceae bacterium]|nr:hypothetical protein [Thermoguttaceae bacterium]